MSSGRKDGGQTVGVRTKRQRVKREKKDLKKEEGTKIVPSSERTQGTGTRS